MLWLSSLSWLWTSSTAEAGLEPWTYDLPASLCWIDGIMSPCMQLQLQLLFSFFSICIWLSPDIQNPKAWGRIGWKVETFGALGLHSNFWFKCFDSSISFLVTHLVFLKTSVGVHLGEKEALELTQCHWKSWQQQWPRKMLVGFCSSLRLSHVQQGKARF